ncbi:MAG: ABC transporter permease [Acidobacteria bacterium]|nr:ABC transporter permease [Acidobacteriota bacterium]
MGWSRFFRRRRWDQERVRELEAYLDQETADNIARGMTPEDAARAARRKLGNPTLIREEIYDMNTVDWLETLWRDVRYGARTLAKNPGFTAVALAALALGIGATTSVFSVVYGVLISPYPYARPAEIWAPVIHDIKNPRRDRSFFHPREYAEFEKLPGVAEVMATAPQSVLLGGDRSPEQFQAVRVTTTAFTFLGVPPLLGRTIGTGDLEPGGDAAHVVVLTYLAWQRLFEGRPEALGKTLTLADERYTVIGVMPPRFGWWTNEGGWIPLTRSSAEEPMAAPIVRLKPGVSKDAAVGQMRGLMAEFARTRPEDFPSGGFSADLENYMDITVASGEMQSALTLLLGAVGFLLLIACANVANLQMARGASRAREIAIRLSIGASRGRLFRQLLTESVLLALAGGLLGILLAVGITRLMVALMPTFYVPNEARITVNVWVLAFSVGVSLLTGILFGMIPAFRASRPDLVESLKSGGRGSDNGGGAMRSALAVAEIALSVVLLIGAGLAIRGFVKLQTTDLGFQPDRVLMTGLQLPVKKYSTYQQRVSFTEQLLEAIQTIPGAQAAAMGNGALPFGGVQTPYRVEGGAPDDSRPLAMGLISAGYNRTLGIQLRAGRELTPQEVAHGDHVALINETAAKLWPAGSNPVGRRLRLEVLGTGDPRVLMAPARDPYVTVVGVLADTRNTGRRNPPVAAAYVPYTLMAPPDRMIAIRSAGEPLALLNALRERVRSLDKDLPLVNPRTLDQVVGLQAVQPRFMMALFTLFAGIGLALAAFGVYSVLSYTVARRTQEIGIRMALGAGRGQVLALFLAMGARLAAGGLGIGLAGGIAITRLMKNAVFGVPGADLPALGSVVVVLAVASLAACAIPARRAANLQPMSALRCD